MKRISRLLTFEEMVLEAAFGHVLVDEHAVVLLVAVADELHQVRVAELHAEVDDLGEPLAVALDAVAVEVEVLDGDGLRAEPRLDLLVDVALVDGAEAAAAEQVAVGEAGGGGLEECVGPVCAPDPAMQLGWGLSLKILGFGARSV